MVIWVTVDTTYERETILFAKSITTDECWYFEFTEYDGTFIRGLGTYENESLSLFIVTTTNIYSLTYKDFQLTYQSSPVHSIKRINNGCTYLVVNEEQAYTLDSISLNIPEDRTKFIKIMNPDININWDTDDYFLEHDEEGRITVLYNYTENTIFRNGKWRSINGFLEPRIYKTIPMMYYDGVGIGDITGRRYSGYERLGP